MNLRLVSCRTDWFDLPAVQGTLKSLFQHHSWKASSFFFSSFILLRFLFFVFFLFIALELIHSISILLMHEDCIRLKLVGICIFFPSNSKLLGCFILSHHCPCLLSVVLQWFSSVLFHCLIPQIGPSFHCSIWLVNF